nr:immunoglobulin heavy chain junction region [Macaca mulatta]MOX14817.1 immunoglobulin heavy chain junction region [Macaca mulatta]MOX14849.1 immunoglobulin heavy chain junction region [Macaca mulatta]MOX14870.1 immunoglobulin heavy chain junction region [Macaca mulatta]MOX14915.1 immunoglobulin heavy chain junction region [Macaca mulatta]
CAKKDQCGIVVW